MILSINQTLLQFLEFKRDQVEGKHFHEILTVSSRIFFQLYFVPLIKTNRKIEEMYISLQSSNGEEIPVMVNALSKKGVEKTVSECVVFPIRKRNEYENELLIAKKESEDALAAMHKANAELEGTLKALEAKQEKLLELNEQNRKFKIDTKKELELAKKIQKTSLTDPISNKLIQIDAFHRASSELSGDIYGFYQIDEHRYGIILLDVMGHGVSSALITMSLHSLFQRLISFGVKSEVVMKELDLHLHRLFQNNEEARHYCTAISLIVNTDEQKIEYTNAGHPPAFWQDTRGKQHELKTTNVPIGMFEGIEYTSNSISFSGGDRLLLYTDGVTDPLSFNHLSALLKENASSPIGVLKEKIIDSLDNQKNKYHKSDDQCFIIIDLI
ncbi:serine phosphatase [Mesobacillus persicus]|uniref:Serine phosphatase n=2 Tax=Mesobacillus persicus TaxID=930146 RepID=A0A1H8IUH8_9BACI|nr:serine phosphatase [Mesobacillus persicus]